MEKKNGIEVGYFIRKVSQDYTTKIIYIFGHGSYAIELFHVQPLYFLAKPLTPKMIIEILKLALKMIRKEMNIFIFETRGKIYSILYKDIMYFESHGKKMSLATLEGEYEFYCSFNKLNNQIHSDDFFSPHRSYWVNRWYVHTICPEFVELSNGVIIPISRLKLNDIKQYFLNNNFY